MRTLGASSVSFPLRFDGDDRLWLEGGEFDCVRDEASGGPLATLENLTQDPRTRRLMVVVRIPGDSVENCDELQRFAKHAKLSNCLKKCRVSKLFGLTVNVPS